MNFFVDVDFGTQDYVVLLDLIGLIDVLFIRLSLVGLVDVVPYYFIYFLPIKKQIKNIHNKKS